MHRFLFILLAVFGMAGLSEAQVSYAGGDGSSFEKAVIIKGATEATGVKAEYAYLEKHFPGYRTEKQALGEHKGRMYDLIEIRTKEGKRLVVFDITDFFGKF